MPATLEVESTLTDRYQTTVPETVRGARWRSRSSPSSRRTRSGT